jgi:hypothetical protein
MRRLFFVEILDALEGRIREALDDVGLESVVVDVAPQNDALEQVVLFSPSPASFDVQDWGSGDGVTPGPCTIRQEWDVRAQIIAVQRGDQVTTPNEVRRLAMTRAQAILEAVLNAAVTIPLDDAPEIVCEPSGGQPPVPSPLSDGDGWYAEAWLDLSCHGAITT